MISSVAITDASTGTSPFGSHPHNAVWDVLRPLTHCLENPDSEAYRVFGFQGPRGWIVSPTFLRWTPTLQYGRTRNQDFRQWQWEKGKMMGSSSNRMHGFCLSIHVDMWWKTRKTYRRRATVWKSGEEPPVRNNSANTAISGSTPLELTEINLLCGLPTLRSSIMQAWINTGSRVVASSPEHEKDHQSAELIRIMAVSQHPSWRQQNDHFWHEFPHIFQTTSRTPCPDLQLLHFSQLLNYLIIELGKPKLKLHR